MALFNDILGPFSVYDSMREGQRVHMSCCQRQMLSVEAQGPGALHVSRPHMSSLPVSSAASHGVSVGLLKMKGLQVLL